MTKKGFNEYSFNSLLEIRKQKPCISNLVLIRLYNLNIIVTLAKLVQI